MIFFFIYYRKNITSFQNEKKKPPIKTVYTLVQQPPSRGYRSTRGVSSSSSGQRRTEKKKKIVLTRIAPWYGARRRLYGRRRCFSTSKVAHVESPRGRITHNDRKHIVYITYYTYYVAGTHRIRGGRLRGVRAVIVCLTIYRHFLFFLDFFFLFSSRVPTAVCRRRKPRVGVRVYYALYGCRTYPPVHHRGGEKNIKYYYKARSAGRVNRGRPEIVSRYRKYYTPRC